MKRKKSFTYDGRDFDVVAVFDNDKWKVKVFENGKPANQIDYSVSGITELDAKMRNDVDPVNSLMEIAEQDYIRWADWLKHNSPKPSH